MREARQEYKRNLMELRERYEERFNVTLESIRKHYERKVQKYVPVYVIWLQEGLVFFVVVCLVRKCEKEREFVSS